MMLRTPDLVWINEKNMLSSGGICCSSETQSENDRKRKDYKNLDFARKLKRKTVDTKVTVIPIVVDAFEMIFKGLKDWKN